jgi:hypothetical protein
VGKNFSTPIQRITNEIREKEETMDNQFSLANLFVKTHQFQEAQIEDLPKPCDHTPSPALPHDLSKSKRPISSPYYEASPLL